MNKPVKLLLMNERKERDHRDHMPRDNYDVDDRLRDRQGREHYNNGRFAPRNDGGMWVDDRQRRDSRGRYMRNEYGYDDGPSMDMDMNYPYYPRYPHIPPIYERGGDYDKERGPMNKIGFALEGEMGRVPPEFDRNYRTAADYRTMDEMAHRKSRWSGGYGHGSGVMPFSRELAKEWTNGMENEDGSRGPHWTMEQTSQVLEQKGFHCDPVEFFAILNSIYSDYSAIAKKHNVNNMDFYADMAKAWLEDKDAVKDKAAAYFEYVVKR